ncbi:hypothetical protein Bealeia1_01265 [Candidatus Bealeia paramacronuclearis]|uniref:Uncharacterized protein n=1 Tax=Candidatus Bealeia paramacronuclearis TaxID=1921001 RepID=A0ABZ2C4U4_9PROT|nr:hypothetical protein [Candidatus Bealeia paramacronuclearis]
MSSINRFFTFPILEAWFGCGNGDEPRYSAIWGRAQLISIPPNFVSLLSELGQSLRFCL